MRQSAEFGTQWTFERTYMKLRTNQIIWPMGSIIDFIDLINEKVAVEIIRDADETRSPALAILNPIKRVIRA